MNIFSSGIFEKQHIDIVIGVSSMYPLYVIIDNASVNGRCEVRSKAMFRIKRFTIIFLVIC